MSIERSLHLLEPEAQSLLLRSGQLVHVPGAPSGEFGIYLEQPPLLASPYRDVEVPDSFPLQQSCFYYHRPTPNLPEEGWRCVPFTAALWRRMTVLGTIIPPVARAGFTVWPVPAQRGVPAIDIAWAHDPRRPHQGRWACSARVPAIVRDFVRYDPPPWGILSPHSVLTARI